MNRDLDNDTFTDGKKVWKVLRLTQLAKKLKTFRIPLKHLNIYNLHPRLESTMDFVDNVKRVVDADLNYPIILDEEGYIMDGRHRVAKCLMLGKKTIKAVRFKDTPFYDYEKDDE